MSKTITFAKLTRTYSKERFIVRLLFFPLMSFLAITEIMAIMVTGKSD